MTDPRKYRTPPGMLRHRVTIQAFAQTSTDGRGQPVGTWRDIDTVAAYVQPLSGRWAEYARQLWESATVRVLVNYRPDVTSACRLLFGGRVLAIGVVQNEDEENHTLVLLCTEAVT